MYNKNTDIRYLNIVLETFTFLFLVKQRLHPVLTGYGPYSWFIVLIFYQSER